jgi:hypothetical protein
MNATPHLGSACDEDLPSKPRVTPWPEVAQVTSRLRFNRSAIYVASWRESRPRVVDRNAAIEKLTRAMRLEDALIYERTADVVYAGAPCSERPMTISGPKRYTFKDTSRVRFT